MLDGTELDAPPVGSFNGEGEVTGSSLVDLIQSELQELAEVKDVTIPVIGYEKSGLAIKYRMPEGGKELDMIAQKCEREVKERWARNLNIAIDTMIALCEGFYVKPLDAPEYVMLDPQDAGYPVKFDARMAVILGLTEEAPARQIVKKLFDGNELAVSNHSEKLGRWLNNTKADLEVELWQMGN